LSQFSLSFVEFSLFENLDSPLIRLSEQSINGFYCAHPYTFDGNIQMATSKLEKIIVKTRSRWNELITLLQVNK